MSDVLYLCTENVCKFSASGLALTPWSWLSQNLIAKSFNACVLNVAIDSCERVMANLVRQDRRS